jgi:hypothetical protein
LQVLDVAEVLGVSKTIPIAIRGEAYNIHIDIKFPQESLTGIDFGAQRVIDDCVKQMALKNTEKYDVRFNFAIISDEVRPLIIRVNAVPSITTAAPGDRRAPGRPATAPRRGDTRRSRARR